LSASAQAQIYLEDSEDFVSFLPHASSARHGVQWCLSTSRLQPVAMTSLAMMPFPVHLGAVYKD